MTISEMHTHFKLELDKTSSLDEIPSFLPEEIDLWLNKGIMKFIKTRYSGINFKKESFEETQKRIDDLRTLVTEATISGGNLTTGTDKPNSFVADLSSLSDTYMFTLGEEVTISYNDIRTPTVDSTKRQGIKEATVNNYRSLIDNPYSEHNLHYEEAQPLRLFQGNNVELITDGDYDVTEYHIRYIKEPSEVDYDTPTNCDLPDHTHDEIVKIAVNMALENIEQPRYQTHANEVNTME